MLNELLILQKTDLKIDNLIREKENIAQKKEHAAIMTGFINIENVIQENSLILKKVKLEQDKLDGEVSIVETKIKEQNDRLYSGKVNNSKELQDIQVKIEQLKNNKSSLEDDDLEVMEKVSVLEDKNNKSKGQLEKLSQKLKELEKVIDEKEKSISEQIQSLKITREKEASIIKDDLMEEYEDLRAKNQGLAIAELEDGVCQACHIELPAVDVDKMKMDGKNYCPFCERMLKV